MNQSLITRLLAALTAERTALANFVALLEREQIILIENLTDQLLDLSEKKTAEALELNKIAETRRSLLHQAVPQLTAPSINDWLAKNNAECLATWQEVLNLIERARQINQINGQLIQAKLRHNQQALTVLSKAADKANLYGPDGQPSFSPGSGRSFGSG